MYQIKFKIITIIVIFNLGFLAFAQELIYQFNDDFNNNHNDWKTTNTSEWESKIENGYFSINNKSDYIYSYFRPNKNAIPKSAKYEISFKIIFNFGAIGENSLGGGIAFIRNENIYEDGTYSSADDNFNIGFTKFQNKTYILFEGFNRARFAWKPIDVNLLDNQEYTVKILIDNSIDTESIKIKIDEKLVCSYNVNLFNFNNIGVFNYPRGAVKINSLEIDSYSGDLKHIDDLYSYDYTINENGQITSQRLKSIEELENNLLDYIPMELIIFYKTPIDKRNVENLIEKLAINSEIKAYKISPEKKNEFNIIEKHCFFYKNNENSICLPVSLDRSNSKSIMNSIYISKNRKKIISYSNIINTIFNLPNIELDGKVIINKRNDDSWEKLYINDEKVTFWF